MMRDYEDEGICPRTPQEKLDESCLNSALGALESWMSLPLPLRELPGGQALLDTSFGLLQTKRYQNVLAQEGAWGAVERDDDDALKCFLAMGADFPKAKEEEGIEEYNRYLRSWESSIAHRCAKIGSFRCLRVFLESGRLDADRSLCEPLLKEPITCPLRQIDLKFLNQKELRALTEKGAEPEEETRAAIDSTNQFIMALLNHQSEQSEELSLSIATSESTTGNPFFVALRKKHADSSERMFGTKPADPAFRQLAFDLADSGLFDPAKTAHRAALLSLCSSGSELACEIALAKGVKPDSAGRHALEDFYKIHCHSNGLNALAPFAKLLCQPWASEAGFAEKIYQWSGSNCLGEIKSLASKDSAASARNKSDWDCRWALERFIALRAHLANAASGFAPADPNELARLEKNSVEKLDAILLDKPVFSKEIKKLVDELSESLSKSCYPTGPTMRL